MNTKNIAVIVGSKNDLKQCVKGLETLEVYTKQGKVSVRVYVRSVHRHTNNLLSLLRILHVRDETDIIIAGAGKAAALPGCIDAYLRFDLKNTKITVLGVAFVTGHAEDDAAAPLSIARVPDTQVIYKGTGAEGFNNACVQACDCETIMWPDIKLKDPPPPLDLDLAGALQLAR